MKKVLLLVILSLLLIGCGQKEMTAEPSVQGDIPPLTQTQPEATEQTQTVPTDPPVQDISEISDFKGIWLSQYDLTSIYTENGVQRDESDFVSRVAEVLDNIKNQGFNTVVLQLRPNADSMYPSDYYPMSRYVVGEYGLDAAYDPVAHIVELAKNRGLSIHAWINPMRAMTTENLEKVGDVYPIRQWYNDTDKNGTYIVQSGAYWYLNPAYEEVRQLIIDGAVELLNRYDFDGLHMDDYFYPTTDSAFDAAAYSELGGTLSLDEFRRDNLNKLVASLHFVTKSGGAGKVFGISPAGNIGTVYERQYADVYTWCSEAGYIDYICPQVYFGLEHQNFDFVSVCNTWQGIIQTDAVDLLIGMSFEKALSQVDAYAGTGKNEWKEHTDILKRCLKYTNQLEKCRGVCVFSYQHFYDPVTGEPVEGTAAEREAFVPVLEAITWQFWGGVG